MQFSKLSDNERVSSSHSKKKTYFLFFESEFIYRIMNKMLHADKIEGYQCK